MKLSRIGKVWFGYLFATAAYDFVKEHINRRPVTHVCGYPINQVEWLLYECYRARPDVLEEAVKADKASSVKFVHGLLTCSPAKFRQVFGFDRPPPR